MENDSKLYFTLLEDNELYAMFITEKLKENFNCQVTVNKTLEEFVEDTALKSHTDIFIVDYNLPGGNGMGAVRALKKEKVDSEIIILSSQSDIQIAVNVLKAGAFDYIIKNDDSSERLVNSIRKAIKIQTLKKENITLKLKINTFKTITGLVILILIAWFSVLLFSK